MANSLMLLDTSVIIRHFRRVQAVSRQLEEAEALFLPAVVLGELSTVPSMDRSVSGNCARSVNFCRR